MLHKVSSFNEEHVNHDKDLKWLMILISSENILFKLKNILYLFIF